MLRDILVGLLGWVPKRPVDALGRLLKRGAVLPVVVGAWVLAGGGMAAAWLGIRQGMGWALAVWFIAPIAAIIITAACFARRAPSGESEPRCGRR